MCVGPNHLLMNPSHDDGFVFNTAYGNLFYALGPLLHTFIDVKKLLDLFIQVKWMFAKRCIDYDRLHVFNDGIPLHHLHKDGMDRC